jgi:nucleoside-diphosphate-sugar epimerase
MVGARIDVFEAECVSPAAVFSVAKLKPNESRDAAMSEPAVHVVFGAGQIGNPLVQLLRARGLRVRLVRRAGGGPEGVEVVTGDAGDAHFAAEAARGAAAIYHCMNPAYDSAVWARELPRLMSALIAAAGTSGARLVVLDNLYLYGDPRGGSLSEDSRVAPCSRKGEIRARIDQQMMSAHVRGDARVVVGRASDFYGPGGTGTYFGDAFWPQVLKGGAAPVLMRLDTPHSYHYTLDVAAALATLGTASDDVTGHSWMLPVADAESSRAMLDRFGVVLGRPLKAQAMPKFAVALLKPFVKILGELEEMAYQWEGPFRVDDRRFRTRFHPEVTSLDAGAAAMVAWARGHYARK